MLDQGRFEQGEEHRVHARVRSFSRAGGRLHGHHAETLAAHGPKYVLDIPRRDAIRTVSTDYRCDAEAIFGRSAPRIVEIGPGSGEALIAHAAAHPDVDYIAVEVWETAIARLVAGIVRENLSNVRVAPVDASQFLQTALAPQSLDEVWTFFPDPWRKARHRKRRLVTVDFARIVARTLKRGGVWRLATDWADYAWQMRDVLEEAAALGIVDYPDAGRAPLQGSDTWVEGDRGNGIDPGSPRGVMGGWSERFEGRVMTRFEQRGIDAGRVIRDLNAIRP
ncbi:tRNA (guanosine(46)-N7)-methyltransferase TrmB [Actinomyces vulturis]|uniref:tRNA (guanosine(46)-N7)-methyltransferase TrmB n=1 Tax=Actinomyces vulturis TaxID=1857645 RepID=UPI0009F4BD7C|nr:tRNA (guanosine(46)-N7)-methyltransferase TrmB [Actinomyces vulturis]